MKFHEFEIGQQFSAGPYEVTESEIIEFANAYDPQWFHTDPVKAEKGHFKGLIASGWHTCSIAMRLITDEVLQNSESFASPGLSYVKWPNPVRPGDKLSVLATVLNVKQANHRNPPLGSLVWRWQLSTSEQIKVLELEATSLFMLSGSMQ